jgi:regulatory GntR family protein
MPAPVRPERYGDGVRFDAEREDQFRTGLFVILERQDRLPLRVQLEEQVRSAIRSGRLEPGMALPSTRALARALGVTRGLVVEWGINRIADLLSPQ